MSAVPESGGTPARRDVPEAGHDAVWMIASPHARWASASGDVQALSVASDEVCCTLHGAPADTMTWLERLRHGVLLTHAPAPGTWLATLVDEGLVQALPATRDGTGAGGAACCRGEDGNAARATLSALLRTGMAGRAADGADRVTRVGRGGRYAHGAIAPCDAAWRQHSACLARMDRAVASVSRSPVAADGAVGRRAVTTDDAVDRVPCAALVARA